MEEVGGTIEWGKDKLNSFPKAKKDIGPLLDALSREYQTVPLIRAFSHTKYQEPLTQIIGGVVLLVGGVLNLVFKILSGLGLDGLLKGIIGSFVRMRLVSP